MQTARRPADVDVAVIVLVILGVLASGGGVYWARRGLEQTSMAMAQVALFDFLVGSAVSVAGVGVFFRRAWSWPLGIVACFVTAGTSLIHLSPSGPDMSASLSVVPLDPLSVLVGLLPAVVIATLARPSIRAYLRTGS